MPLEINFGLDATQLKTGQKSPVIWSEKQVVNPHILLVGMSGSGKTHNLRHFVNQFVESADHDLRVHVFDIHGDIRIEGASSVMFSEQTSYGLNPLVVNPDPHYGGVRKTIQSFISILNKSRALGVKQESVIRNLLVDLYSSFGFQINRPETWLVQQNEGALDAIDGRIYLEVPFAEKDDARALGAKWDADGRKGWWVAEGDYRGAITRWPPRLIGRRQPTIADLLSHAGIVQKRVFMGANHKSIVALESFQRASRAYQRRLVDSLKHGEGRGPAEDPETDSEVEKAGEKAIEAYASYVKEVKTGRELDSFMRYDSADVLKSVVDRLENLNSIGIFRAVPPPFDESAPVWRYQLKALSMQERKLFVLFKLQELFVNAIQRGESKTVREVIILDEAHAFCDDNEDNIINTIAREARKFGLALVAASQAPNHFTEDFLTSVGTKMVLGIDEMYWDGASRRLKLDMKALGWIKLRQTCAVQVKETNEARNLWKWVVLPRG